MWSFHGGSHKSSNDWIDTSLEEDLSGFEDAVAEKEATVSNVVAREVDSLVELFNHSVSETEGRSRELVGNRGIHIRVVSFVWSDNLVERGPEKFWKILLVENILNLSSNDLTSFLEHSISTPCRVQFGELLSDSVVFSGEKDVKRGESDEEVGTDVSGGERSSALVFVGTFGLIEWEHVLVVEASDSQESCSSVSELVQIFRGASVNHGSVNVGGVLVELFSRFYPADWSGSGHFEALFRLESQVRILLPDRNRHAFRRNRVASLAVCRWL